MRSVHVPVGHEATLKSIHAIVTVLLLR